MTIEGLAAALADRYTIERELGGGGMSRVYLAQETALGRSVVIKVIAPELAEGLSAERFTREVKLAARLQQANIVPVLTAGTAAGLPFYIMPYVDGESLRASIGRPSGPPSALSHRISILRDVARALAYAHAHGVVHRDIKPENILLSGGAAVVTDFGIAKAISASRTQETASGDAALTQAGNSIGTPAYMAPEQAVGAPVDHRADIYSWGMVAYELLSGAHPFAGRSGSQQLIAAHIAEIPAPLGTNAPSVPRPISDLVMQCLVKDPARRSANAEQLLNGLSVMATASAGPRRWAMIGGIALLALAGLYVWKGRSSPAVAKAEQDRRVIAILPFRNLSSDTAQQYFSAGMTEEVTAQLGKVAALRVLGRGATAPYEKEADRLQRMGKELGVGSVVDGSVQLAGNRVRINVTLTDVSTGVSLWSEKYDREVADLFALQDDVARKVTTALQAKLTDDESYRLSHAPTSSIEAYQLYLRGKNFRPQVRAENLAMTDLLRQAIQIDTSFALAYAFLGRVYMFRFTSGDRVAYDSGLVAARRAIALDPRLADGYFALGDLLSLQMRVSKSREAYLKAIELSPSHDGAMADLSNLLLMEGKYDEALDMAVRAAQINPRHPSVPYHVGVALLMLGDDSATGRYLRNAERRAPRFPRTQGLLAELSVRQGDSAGALERARRAVRDNPGDTEAEFGLAEIAVTVGASDAAALVKPIIDQDPNSPTQYLGAGFRALYALLLARRGDTAQANALWWQSDEHVQADIRAGAEGSYDVMELAAIAAMQGRTTEALELLEQGHHLGYSDAGAMRVEPSFESIRTEPRYQAVIASMEQKLGVMRQRAKAVHPELFAAQ